METKNTGKKLDRRATNRKRKNKKTEKKISKENIYAVMKCNMQFLYAHVYFMSYEHDSAID
jgi:hypothetical protein